MIHIENTKTYGWNAAIRGMRNPLNSWDKFDTVFATDGEVFHIGSADFFLMKRLVQSGTDHSKFMRMITVDFDLTAPLYWWKEYDTYKIGTVANSCSTMHKIHTKEFVMDDFSHENLMETNEVGKDKPVPMDVLRAVIGTLNYCREKYIETKDKRWWEQLIQLLPSSYNQKRTLQLNYAVLRNIYHARMNHKLDEWHIFCRWAETLPYSELITV